ncbi:MAG: hypothetical protein KKA79_04685 [Nanoarchaeota archaeon]|nr:hypothetical protein [Nanoarchaeota archaeon]MCG2717374.1 hypothetical protein [Nanoarchaeota archaeon]
MAKKVKDEKYWEEFGKRMGKKFGNAKVHRYSCCAGFSSFALMILLIGVYLLARDMGWIPDKISGWTLFFILLGFYWLVKSLFKRTC